MTTLNGSTTDTQIFSIVTDFSVLATAGSFPKLSIMSKIVEELDTLISDPSNTEKVESTPWLYFDNEGTANKGVFAVEIRFKANTMEQALRYNLAIVSKLVESKALEQSFINLRLVGISPRSMDE